MSASPVSALPPAAPAVAATVPASRTETAAPQADVVQKKSDAKPSQADLEKAVATLNKFVQPMAHSINFSIDSSTGKTVIKVMDTENNTVIQQFPSEDALSMTRALDKLHGLLVKEKA